MKIDLTKLLGFRIAAAANHDGGADDKAVRLSAKIGQKVGQKPSVDAG